MVTGGPHNRFTAPSGDGIFSAHGRLAQRESAAFTRQRSLVRNQHRPLRKVGRNCGSLRRNCRRRRVCTARHIYARPQDVESTTMLLTARLGRLCRSRDPSIQDPASGLRRTRLLGSRVNSPCATLGMPTIGRGTVPDGRVYPRRHPGTRPGGDEGKERGGGKIDPLCGGAGGRGVLLGPGRGLLVALSSLFFPFRDGGRGGAPGLRTAPP